MMKKYLVILLAFALAVFAPVSVAVSATEGDPLLPDPTGGASPEIHVKTFTVEDSTVMDGVNGYYCDFHGTTGNFYFDIRPTFTVELEDGTVLLSGENGVEIDGNAYNLYYEFTDGSSITDPSVGTHHAIGYFMGVEDEFDVTVLESPVASVEIEDMVLEAYVADGYFADPYSYYYYAGGSGNPLYIYRLHPTFTVTLKDGRVLHSENGAVEIDGILCDVFGFSVNQAAQPFLPGNTYTVTGYFMGASDTFDVTVTQEGVFPCGRNVVGVLDEYAATLTLKGKGPMYEFVTAMPWDEYPVQTVVIEDGVTSITDGAFAGCSGLTSITIPESVIQIGQNAFIGCSGLESITVAPGNPVYHSAGNCLIETASKVLIAGCENSVIPMDDSVTSIGNYAFLDCSGLKKITLPNSVTQIGEGAFSGCSGLTVIAIPYGVTSIRDNTFSKCSGLKKVTLPNSVTSIDWCAFYGCSGLMEITFPNSVTSIDHYAFYGCTDLTSITIPDSVISIKNSAFFGCTGLTNITVAYGNPVYHSAGNCLIETESKTLILGCQRSLIPKDDSVTFIGQDAFRGCVGLTDIVIPNNILSIGESAFADCAALTAITIPDSVTSIGFEAFYRCGELLSITVDPANPVYHSEGNCLMETESKTLILGCQNSLIPKDGSVTVIGRNAFAGCAGLTSILIPDSITFIGDSAFSECTGLTSVVIPDDCTDIGWYAFLGCSGLTEITIPDGAKVIRYETFCDCTGLTSVTIPESVTNIECEAFLGCTELTDIDYFGTAEQWNEIGIDEQNEPLLTAAVHFLASTKYTITYYLNGGKNNASNPKTYTPSAETNTLKNPTRSGYTFKGWYKESTFKTKVTAIQKGSKGNIKLYARWAKTYKITYKLNSGTNNKNNPKTYTKIDATITLKNPTRKGYTFKGWYSDAKFTKKVTKIAKESTGNKTLYAKWVKNTYKITYKLNSGKNNAKNPKTYTVTTATITLKNPTRKGYTFKGWYSDAKFTKKVTKITKGSTGNKTLYAKWKKK